MSSHFPAELAAAAGTAAAASVVYIWRKGTLQGWRQNRRQKRENDEESLEAIGRIEDISVETYKRVGEVEAEVKVVGEKVDAVGETVFRLHESDPQVQDTDALRDSLDVDELADDFMRSEEDGE